MRPVNIRNIEYTLDARCSSYLHRHSFGHSLFESLWERMDSPLWDYLLGRP